jgi:ribonuclease HI
MIFKCQGAMNIWRSLGLEHLIMDACIDGRSGPAVIQVLFRAPNACVPGYTSIQVHNLIAVAAWYIWWLRRRQTRGEQIPPVRNCSTAICAITANAAKSESTKGPAKLSWSKPSGNRLKLNVDAAFVVEDQAGASGAVLRNNQGVFVAASSSFIPHVSSATMAEALAMLHGLLFAHSLGYHDIVAESDSLEVINLCSGEDRIWNEATAVYADILSCVGAIGKVEFIHCVRDLNKVAHSLARDCYNSRVTCNWVDEPPSFILDSLLNDVMIL